MKVWGRTCDAIEHPSFGQKAGCFLRGRSRLTLEAERAPRDPGSLAERIRPAVTPYRVSAELSHSFDALLRAGMFVRVHDGQDYYNIGFVKRRRVFLFGLMLDASGADRIGRKVEVE
jgi:hypothetical protein